MNIIVEVLRWSMIVLTVSATVSFSVMIWMCWRIDRRHKRGIGSFKADRDWLSVLRALRAISQSGLDTPASVIARNCLAEIGDEEEVQAS